jgi:two-component system LytT family sensor kinase
MRLPDFYQKNRFVSLHVAALLLYVFSPLFFGIMRPERPDNMPWALIANNSLTACFFYLNLLVLIPYILKRRDWITYLIVGAVCTLGFVVISHHLREYFFDREFRLPPFEGKRGALPARPFPYFGLIAPYLITWIFSISVRFSMDYFQLEKMRKERENENLRSELALLRSQISPHFMFNVLNSLTALARKKSDDLEPIIIKLSQLLRYALYYSAVSRVAIETELEYLQNYIDLQRLRFGNFVNVRFEKRVLQPDFQIEPMLLIAFVENAFKHGLGLNEDPVIMISVDCENGVLKFSLRNKFTSNTTKDETHGVGLKNVRQRLELLYENCHDLTIKDENPWFIVELTLIGK